MVARLLQSFLLPVIVVTLLGGGGCASKTRSPGPRAAPATPAAAEYPLIVRLEGRHYSVDACSGPTGVVYTVHGRDGHLIVANATLDEVRQRYPEIHQQIIPGIAEKDEPSNSDRSTASDAETDASIDGPIPMGRRDLSAGRTLLMMDASR